MKKSILIFTFLLIGIALNAQTNPWYIQSTSPKNITRLIIEDSSDYSKSIVGTIDIIFDSDTVLSNSEKKMISSFKNVFSGKFTIDEFLHDGSNSYHNVISGKNYKYIYNIFKEIGTCHRENTGSNVVDVYVTKNRIILYTEVFYSDNKIDRFELICSIDVKFIEFHRIIDKNIQ